MGSAPAPRNLLKKVDENFYWGAPDTVITIIIKRTDMNNFLPTTKEEMLQIDWYYYDFLLITGDAYIDHPSFGAAVISRLLESKGYRTAVLSQPNWNTCKDFTDMGKPRYGVFIGAGNLDSMVARYTAAKKPRSQDFYSPAAKAGLRPDRATIVYANRAREAFGSDMPIIIGGLEASLRRFAHYDYWDDKVRRSILIDSKADLLVYGMGERATAEIASRLKKKHALSEITNIPGTAYISSNPPSHKPDDSEGYIKKPIEYMVLNSYEEVLKDKAKYARAAKAEYEEHDHVRGKGLIQPHGDKLLIVNPPAKPLNTRELDEIAELPYTREYHPKYENQGGVPAITEVRFSVIHNRGCFGACNFCALAFHQGRAVTSRSHQSVIREVQAMTKHPEFKGFVSDVGGPTANFRHPSCKKQKNHGMCRDKKCLAPKPCSQLDADHSDYTELLRKLRNIDGVKKVFVRSGIRFDYMLEDKNGEFFSELVNNHISGQLKVAPEHCIDSVLDYMGKPPIDVYERFMERYKRLNQRHGKQQYVVPYLMSSHPGSTLSDAVALAEYLNRAGRVPEQVQDFYPTPGTISTCMYYTGIDPRTMEPVYVPKTPREKALQRALLQWKRPDKKSLVIEALKKAGREDLIGYEKRCLVRPYAQGSGSKNRESIKQSKSKQKNKAPGRHKIRHRKEG